MVSLLYWLCAIVEVSLYALLALASVHLLLRARWGLSQGPLLPAAHVDAPSDAPFVTVQIPLRNEALVAEGALRSAAALRWPHDRLEIQALDDSDDETVELVDTVAAELQASGVAISVVRRRGRRGYKAGALAAGLPAARGELIFVLDADFRPEPTLLAQLVAALVADPALAFVQARWSFRNERSSLLTRLEAAILDALFTVEQAELSARAAPVQFNGTGGLWRRSAIERAGGWATDDDALTEDLDLSFRAHEAGLRGVTLPALAVSTELPVPMASFRTQQARWVRGGALSLRALGRRLLANASGKDARTMLAHLARHARQPLFLLAALRLPIVAWCGVVPILPSLVGPSVFFGMSISAALYLGAAQRRIGRSLGDGLLLAPQLLILSVGLAPALTLAFLGGLFGRTPGGFIRTEKLGDAPVRTKSRRDLAALAGLGVAATALLALVPFVREHDVIGVLASLFVALSCAWVAS